eukprot:198599-Chlamydomonas_euryale.AAC.1
MVAGRAASLIRTAVAGSAAPPNVTSVMDAAHVGSARSRGQGGKVRCGAEEGVECDGCNEAGSGATEVTEARATVGDLTLLMVGE